jgi:predicted nicotinamide N-methyase
MRFAEWLAVERVPFVPEVRLHQGDDIQAMWEAVGSVPYWAFPWLGGQALARYVLDHDVVRGLRVLDLATGSGLVAIAAVLAGAQQVIAVDIDPLAGDAVAANAAANGVAVDFLCQDLLDGPVPDVDLVLAGDAFYEKHMAERFLAWLPAGALVGDPGREYLPREGLEELAVYDIGTTRELEGVTVRRTRVVRVRDRPGQ